MNQLRSYMMKKYVIIILLLFLSACGQQPTFKDENGNIIDFSQLRGNWVFINYWASWCEPCYTEIPEINAFYNTHKNDHVVVLGVNYDRPDSNDHLLQIIQKMGIEFPTLKSDPTQALKIGDIPGLPATFVFDPKGKLVARLFGEQTQKSLEEIII